MDGEGVVKDLRVRGTVTPEDQLRRWADGDPVCPNTVGECCPDFSCCRKHLLWPEEKRRLFVQADRPTRDRMLVGSLAALSADAGLRAHVIGGGGPENRPQPPPTSRTPPQRRGKR
jgi:hypothetical protein